MVAIASAALGRERIGRLHWIGAAISMSGIYFVVGHGASFGGATVRGDLLMMVSVGCWAAYTLGASRLIARHSPLYVTGISGSGNAQGRGRVQRGMDLQQRIAAFVPALRSLRIPVIAAVNGAASGGGLALALASDVRVAARAARFNVAFVRIGLSGCDIGVSWLLPRWIGASRAFELLLTGRMVESDEAERIGLVSRVVDDDDLMAEAAATARLIAGNSPTGVWMTKEVMWSNLEIASMRAGIDLENRTQIMTSFTEDTAEAVGAFFERRPPEFRNC